MQLAQTGHGMAEFARDHPAEFTAWMATSNYICILQVPGEDELLEHADVLTGWCGPHLSEFDGIPFSLVYEPDIGEHTAIVIAPGAYHSRLSSLPLAGREVSLA
jgi:hypothetical protein